MLTFLLLLSLWLTLGVIGTIICVVFDYGWEVDEKTLVKVFDDNWGLTLILMGPITLILVGWYIAEDKIFGSRSFKELLAIFIIKIISLFRKDDEEC